jgi:hypothetical protein
MGNRTPRHRAATAAKPAMPKTIYGIDSPWCSPLLERCRIKILHYQVQVIQHRFPKTLAFQLEGTNAASAFQPQFKCGFMVIPLRE